MSHFGAACSRTGVWLPFDPVLMFNIPVLQALYSLLDEATEFRIKGRLSFQRFLGLGLYGTVPNATMVWLL